MDGSWKENNIHCGQWWYSTLEGFDGLMGARNTMASLLITTSFGSWSPHLGNEKFKAVSRHVCNGLFSNGEDGFGTRKIACFCKLFGRYQDTKEKFQSFKAHSYTPDA